MTFCFNLEGHDDDLDFIVLMMNLFNGQLHFDEIYNMPVDLAADLLQAKLRLKEEEEKQIKRMEENSNSSNSENRTQNQANFSKQFFGG